MKRFVENPEVGIPERAAGGSGIKSSSALKKERSTDDD